MEKASLTFEDFFDFILETKWIGKRGQIASALDVPYHIANQNINRMKGGDCFKSDFIDHINRSKGQLAEELCRPEGGIDRSIATLRHKAVQLLEKYDCNKRQIDILEGVVSKTESPCDNYISLFQEAFVNLISCLEHRSSIMKSEELSASSAKASGLIAESYTDLLTLIKDSKNKISSPNDEEIWFRGQADAKYSLLPSLFRTEKGREVEKAMFFKYRQLSRKLPTVYNETSAWDDLFYMQHYSIPTRLLDWSENLGIALFFATYGCKAETDVGLYLLNPHKLNKKSSLQGIPIIPDDVMGLEYMENYLNNTSITPHFPIAIKPYFTNDRLNAQRGMFTIHGNNLENIENSCSEAVVKIIIKHKAIEEIKDNLHIFGINESTVFPDMQGVAYHVRRLLE